MQFLLKRGINCSSTLIHYPQTPTTEGICSWLIKRQQKQSSETAHICVFPAIMQPCFKRRWAEQHVIIHRPSSFEQRNAEERGSCSTNCFAKVLGRFAGPTPALLPLPPVSRWLTTLRCSNTPLVCLCRVPLLSPAKHYFSAPSSKK